MSDEKLGDGIREVSAAELAAALGVSEENLLERTAVPDMQMILPTSAELLGMAANALQACCMSLALERLLYGVPGGDGRLTPTPAEMAVALRGPSFSSVVRLLRATWAQGKIVEPPKEAG
jgi:hypothetical protein